MRPIPKFILAAICLSISASQPAQSQTVFTWTGAAGTGWNTAGNWINGVPVSAIDTALVFDSPTQPVTINNLPGGLTLNSFTLSPDAGLRTFSGNELRFAGVDPELIDLVATGPVILALPIVLNETLSVASGPSLSSQLFLDGAVSGAGGLVFRSGFGNLRGSNMYTGATNVEGTASLGAIGSNSLGASTIVTVAADAELQIIRFNAATSTTINRPLSLAGALTSPSRNINSGFGAVSSAQYSGSITLTGNAEIRAFNGVGEGTNSVEFKISGAINRAGNDLQIATAGQFNSVTVFSPISGNGNLTLRPEGGTITLSAVTGDGDVSVAGAGTRVKVTLDSLTGAGNFDVSPSATFGRVTVAGAIVGNRNISLTSGQLRLNSAASTFTGSITLSGLGILSIADQSRLGNAANTVQFNGGGGLDLTGDGEFSRPITITGGRASIDTNAFSRTFSAPITGTGELELSNFGSNRLVTLSGANSFQGGLRIGPNVTVLYAADANLGAAGGGLTLNGGSLALRDGVGTFDRPIAVTSSNGSISEASVNDVVLAGNLSGPGLLTLNSAKFSITGTNTNSGGLAVAGGSLAIDSDARLGDASAVLNLGRQNGLAVLPGELKALGDLTIAATRSTSFRNMTVNTNGHSVVFNQPIAGRGIVKQGEGVWTLNTVNSDASGNNEVTIEKGTLRIGIANALGSRANINSIADGGSLDLGSTDLELLRLTNVAPGAEIKLGTGTLALRTAADISGIITGAGSVVLGVPGFSSQGFVFAGQNSFSGGLTIQAGARLSVQHPQALGSAGNPITLDGGALGITSQAASPLTIDATTPLIIGSGGAEFVADGQSILISSQLTGTNPFALAAGANRPQRINTMSGSFTRIIPSPGR